MYIFYPILKGQGAFFVKFCPCVQLVFESGVWSSAGYDGARMVNTQYVMLIRSLHLYNGFNGINQPPKGKMITFKIMETGPNWNKNQ